MARDILARTGMAVLILVLLWILTFVAIALLRGGCGLDYVLPWYSSAYDQCSAS